MKYRQLTKEQFESLHEEFAKFLATQQIDVNEWTQLKKEKPHMAEEEMSIFSDMVWEDVLTKTEYIDHFSKNTINVFKCDANEIHRIVVQVNKEINLLEKNDYTWLLNNLNNQSVEVFTGTKCYIDKRNFEIFDLIEKGGVITRGELFLYLDKMLKK